MKNLILVFLLAPIIAFGSNHHLKGFVIDAHSKAPLIGALIYWDGTEEATVTNEKGHFEINKSSLSNILIIDYTGYQAKKIKITDQHEMVISLTEGNEISSVDIIIEKPASSIGMYNSIKIETLGKKELAKAACCNLSESFETNPTVDVSFTDAVTGTKQIQLLGLAGPYSLISSGNIPTLTGNSSVLGMDFIPGQWLNSIQLIKGTGSVVNGYSSIAGQINTEYIASDSEEKLFLNLYGNSGTRLEFNAISRIKVNKNVFSRLFIQADNGYKEIDNNKDGFMDNQLGPKVVLMNTWSYHNDSSNWESKSGVKFDFTDKTSGQTSRTSPKYAVRNQQNKFEAWSKNGYIFKDKPGRSTGLQTHFFIDEKDFDFGNNTLSANETKFYANWIYADIINTTDHSIKTGLTYTYNTIENSFNTLSYGWNENVIGSFFEHTYKPSETFSLVSGIRLDQSSVWGTIFTPRIHGRWGISENNVFRFSGGRGTKNPNPFLENIGTFVSSRDVILPNKLEQESGWNYGMNFTKKFKLLSRSSTLSFDLYRTDFDNKLVTDLDKNANEVNYYFVKNASYANSFMAQLKLEPIKKLHLNFAYRFYDVKTKQETTGYISSQLLPNHRAFVNGEYQIKDKWFLDATLNWNGKSRIPANQLATSNNSEPFSTLNAQIRFKPNKTWDYYIGGENLFNYQQESPIINSDNPFDPGFDASLIWAPVFGTKLYFGIKYLI